jgi:hypothetical protein
MSERKEQPQASLEEGAQQSSPLNNGEASGAPKVS